MDPILQQALKNLAPPVPKKISLKEYNKKKAAEEYKWPIDRLPTEPEGDTSEPLLQSYELEVWKELIGTDEDIPFKANSDTQYKGPEGRRSTRWKVPLERQSCEVKIGGNVYSGALLDESRDGFALVVDNLNDLKVGQKVEVHTYQGWFKVRIVHLNPVAKPKDAPIASDSCLRLGTKKA
jgi:hypothetical protein